MFVDCLGENQLFRSATPDQTASRKKRGGASVLASILTPYRHGTAPGQSAALAGEPLHALSTQSHEYQDRFIPARSTTDSQFAQLAFAGILGPRDSDDRRTRMLYV